jgi:integrase
MEIDMSLIKHEFKLKDGTKKQTEAWYYRFQYKGKTYFGSTKTANKKLAEAVEKKTYEDLISKFELGVVESITVAEAIKNYLAAMTDSGEYHTKVSYTKKLLGTKIDNHSADRNEVSIFGFNGDWKFEKIDDAVVSKLVLSRKTEGNKSGTILGELSVLSQMIAINKQLKVPVPKLDLKEIKKLNQLKPSKGKLRYLTKKEETALLAELHPDKAMNGIGGTPIESMVKQRQDVYDFVVLLLDLGARHTEIATLTWDDVDMKNKTVNIYRNKVKNQSVLHCTKRVMEVLERRLNDDDKDDKHVFTAKDGGPRKYSNRAVKSACKRAGITGICFHSTRHTFGSRLVQRGVSLQEVSQLLGHASPSTSLIYSHLVPNQAAERAARLLEEV